MTEFLGFRKMMTPVIIQIIFWIAVAVSVLSGIVLMIAGGAASAEANRFGATASLPGGLLVFAGLLQIVFGPILVRISCELIILSFRIYEALTEIRDAGRNRPPASAPLYSPSYPQTDPGYTTH